MAKRFSAVLCLLSLILFQASVSAAEAADSPGGAKRNHDGIFEGIKERGKLIVAQVGVDQPPFFWRKDTGGKTEWVGYEIDLARRIADKLGVKLEILRLGDDYNEVCKAVAEGRADLGISNLSNTEARREIVDFTEPYIVSRVAMLVNLEALEKSGIDAVEPKDLDRPDVKVALTDGSAYAFVADELMPRAERVIVPQGDFDHIARPVIDGTAHVLVDDGLTLNLGMSQHPEYSPRIYLHVFGEYDDPLSICLPRNQPRLREFVNAVIQEIEDAEPVTLEYLVEQYMK